MQRISLKQDDDASDDDAAAVDTITADTTVGAKLPFGIVNNDS